MFSPAENYSFTVRKHMHTMESVFLRSRSAFCVPHRGKKNRA